MGSALSCMERGSWDAHPDVHASYAPAPEPAQDMDRPLPHYFISSGHNSYLQGNQLTSSAGTHTIEVGLKHGCRVVELDVYDGPHGAPIVTHGGTLTSSVTFHDCVKAVAKHAWHCSPWPVILTLENHAGKEQQVAMARDLEHLLGSHLHVPDPQQLARDGAYPSPAQAQRQVLVRMKVKPGAVAPELERLVTIHNSSISSYDVHAGPAVPSSHSLPDNKLPHVPEYEAFAATSSLFGAGSKLKPNGSMRGTKNRSGMPDTQQCADQAGTASITPVPSPAAVAAVAAATAGAGGETIAGAAAAAGGKPAVTNAGKPAISHIKSFAIDVAAEVQLEAEQDDTLATDAADAALTAAPSAAGLASDLAKPHLAQVLAYSAKHLIRIYPGAVRMLDNSNFNPAAAWSCGASLAALNWQLWDAPLWVNQAFFSRFDTSGYVLKPDFMTSHVRREGLPERQPKVLSVNVYSAFRPQGRRMGAFKDDPYVELQVHGLPCDAAAQQSEHINNSGRLVVERSFEFDVRFPELAVLLVLLKDHDTTLTDSVLGYCGIPLATLAPGEYKLRLAERKRMGGSSAHTGMWIKVKLDLR